MTAVKGYIHHSVCLQDGSAWFSAAMCLRIRSTQTKVVPSISIELQPATAPVRNELHWFLQSDMCHKQGDTCHKQGHGGILSQSLPSTSLACRKSGQLKFVLPNPFPIN